MKIFSVFIFFTITPSILLFTLFYLTFAPHRTQTRVLSATSFKPNLQAELMLKEESQQQVEKKDARVEAVKDFFSSYDSPLTTYAQDIVSAADAYNIDYRLLPAIAMQESNLCKKIIKDSHNCWGFGIYGKRVTKFENFKEAIETISKTLAFYRTLGLETPSEIQPKYNPANTNNWNEGVSHFMEKLQIASN